MEAPDQNAIDRSDLQKFANGDERAMAELVKRYSAPLLNHAAHLLVGNIAAAEDVTQESFVKMWQNADNLLTKEPLYLRAWLFRVARNACLDRLRQSSRYGGEVDENIADDRIGADVEIEKGQRANKVMAWINGLPERQKSALLLAHFERMSNPEIAQILDTSIEAVENLLARARRQLRASAQSEKEEV